jgi:hypothetical protein
VLGISEKVFHSIREAGSVRDGIGRVVANANLDRFLGLVLLISLTVGTFLVMQEISRAMGKGRCSGCFSSRRRSVRDHNHQCSEERSTKVARARHGGLTPEGRRRLSPAMKKRWAEDKMKGK